MDKQLHRENNLKRLKLVYYIAGCVSLLTGIVIYALFKNTTNILLFKFFPRLLFLNTLYTPIKIDSIWAYMLSYNVPDGLWCLSALLLTRAIWLTNTFWHIVYGGIFIVIAMAFEIAQLFGIIPGTFDTLDLMFIVFLAFMESIIFYLFIRRRIA